MVAYQHLKILMILGKAGIVELKNLIMKPIAKGYLFTTPEPIDRGITTFFNNIDDIGVTINDLLQFKIVQAGMDIATLIDLPKHNEDFEQILGVLEVPPGSYLVLPFWDPSSPRGMAGLLRDALMDPLNYTIFAGFALSATGTVADAVNVTDQRAGFMTTEKAALNCYDFIKNSYQQRREYLINDGKEAEDDLVEEDLDFDNEIVFK